MGTRAPWFALVLAIPLTGCKYGAAEFACSTDEQCRGAGATDGKCQVGFCSFPDMGCPSGYRFGDLAGGNSHMCVGGEHLDAGRDTSDPGIDAQVCFGSTFTLCLGAPPMGDLAITAATTINTDVDPMCKQPKSGGDACVLAAQRIDVTAALRATGTKPLVLIASDTITTSGAGTIDVGSHRGANPETGAAADFSGCGGGTAPGTNGGGAGGSFAGLGGGGGSGAGGAGGTATAVTVNLTLRGGCAGQDGNGANKGVKGHSGGAVYLVAGNVLSLGAPINAGGEGGQAGATASSGGGGGGAGGLIALEAPMVTATALLLANGGAGGEGSGNATAGNNGADATTTAAAIGGNGGSTNGGNGGNGSAGATLTGAAGQSSANGGGGGGGAAGFIKVRSPNANLGTNVSPPAT